MLLIQGFSRWRLGLLKHSGFRLHSADRNATASPAWRYFGNDRLNSIVGQHCKLWYNEAVVVAVLQKLQPVALSLNGKDVWPLKKAG